MKSFNIGIVTTGSEVYYHRIKDKFGPILRGKMEGYHCTVAGQTFVPDNKEMIEQAIKDWLDKGADMVFCTGGMSVDPDDLTPATKLNRTREELEKSWMARMGNDCTFISARTGEGMDELRRLLYERVKEIHIQRYPYNDFLYQDYSDLMDDGAE